MRCCFILMIDLTIHLMYLTKILKSGREKITEEKS